MNRSPVRRKSPCSSYKKNDCKKQDNCIWITNKGCRSMDKHVQVLLERQKDVHELLLDIEKRINQLELTKYNIEPLELAIMVDKFRKGDEARKQWAKSIQEEKYDIKTYNSHCKTFVVDIFGKQVKVKAQTFHAYESRCIEIFKELCGNIPQLSFNADPNYR